MNACIIQPPYSVDPTQADRIFDWEMDALGADEIELDLWYTKDGELVLTHDRDLSRTSDGSGFVYDCTYEQLLKPDFGTKFSNGMPA